MAFIKNLNPTKVSGREFTKSPNELSKTGSLSVPFVYLKKNKPDGSTQINGFVPGFSMNDSISDTVENCHLLLLPRVKEKIQQKIVGGLPFPYFPTNDEIIADYKPVAIKRIVIKNIPNKKH